MKILLSGSSGRMGQAISELVKSDPTLQISGGINNTKVVETDYPQYGSCQEVKGSSDVMIDFTHYSLLEQVLQCCLIRKSPLVIGTTGITEQGYELIKQASERIPIFVSGNMSIGIHWLRKLVRESTAALRPNFDIEIVEHHHRHKVDSPSGTAYMIAKEAMQADPTLEIVHGREGNDALRKPNELGMHAVRGGGIIGQHSVLFASEQESIEIAHRAESRFVFAHGALEAAKFIVSQSPGIYTMDELLATE